MLSSAEATEGMETAECKCAVWNCRLCCRTKYEVPSGCGDDDTSTLMPWQSPYIHLWSWTLFLYKHTHTTFGRNFTVRYIYSRDDGKDLSFARSNDDDHGAPRRIESMFHISTNRFALHTAERRASSVELFFLLPFRHHLLEYYVNCRQPCRSTSR